MSFVAIRRLLMFSALLVALQWNAQETLAQSLKVYISVDMEGTGGVVNPADAGSNPDADYEMFRRVLTDEVNAAVEGALLAGATEIVVEEHHGARGFRNLLVDRLHPRAQLVRGWPRPRGGITGLDSSFDGVMFIGYHAREGTAKAVLAHTFLENAVADLEVSGRSIGEGEFNATVAGALGVPVVLVSGDDAVVKQMRDFLGDVEGVVVKHALSRTAAFVVSPQISTARIQAAAERALRRLSDFRPVTIEWPARVQFRFKASWDERIERIVMEHPEISRPENRVLGRTCHNVDELIDFYMVALDIGLESSPLLRPER